MWSIGRATGGERVGQTMTDTDRGGPSPGTGVSVEVAWTACLAEP